MFTLVIFKFTLNLMKFRSMVMTIWVGSLFHCTTANGNISICNDNHLLNLNKVHRVHGSGHFDGIVVICWHQYLNKAIAMMTIL